MIINMPLNIDEKAIESKLTEELESQMKKEVKKRVEAFSESRGYYEKSPLENMVNEAIDNFVKEHADEIIEESIKKITNRISSRKKVKEVAK